MKSKEMTAKQRLSCQKIKALFQIAMGLIIFAIVPCVSVTSADAANKKKATKALSNAHIKKIIIQESIDQYPGNCPCPYNIASNGSRCGKRSAYSRQGGYAPICYESDVTQEMIREWRKNH